MITKIVPGDGFTFAHHVLTLNLDEVFHYDLPKVLGFQKREAKVLRDGWAKLDITVQNALLHGTGILDTIAQDLNAVPKTVVDNILTRFTDTKIEDLQVWLAQVQGVFTGVAAIPNQDVETTIKNLQDYIKSSVDIGPKLGCILSLLAQGLAIVINPVSAVGQIATYTETAYQIIKSVFGKKTTP